MRPFTVPAKQIKANTETKKEKEKDLRRRDARALDACKLEQLRSKSMQRWLSAIVLTKGVDLHRKNACAC